MIEKKKTHLKITKGVDETRTLVKEDKETFKITGGGNGS